MKTTICPTDSSRAAVNAVQFTTSLCKAMQSDLVFVNKPSVTGLFTSPQQVGHLAGTAYEQRAAVDYRCQPDPVSQIQHIFAIAQDAHTAHAELIATGIDKEFSYNDIYNQSVSNLATQAKCPALLIPEGTAFKPLKKIVLVIDHEFNIIHRMSAIARMAGVFGAEILFLQINTEKNRATGHSFYTSAVDMYLAFPYAHTSFHEVISECMPEAIRIFSKKVQADLIITVPQQLEEIPYTQATSLYYNELRAQPLSIPLLVLDAQPKQLVNIVGYPFN